MLRRGRGRGYFRGDKSLSHNQPRIPAIPPFPFQQQKFSSVGSAPRVSQSYTSCGLSNPVLQGWSFNCGGNSSRFPVPFREEPTRGPPQCYLISSMPKPRPNTLTQEEWDVLNHNGRPVHRNVCAVVCCCTFGEDDTMQRIFSFCCSAKEHSEHTEKKAIQQVIMLENGSGRDLRKMVLISSRSPCIPCAQDMITFVKSRRFSLNLYFTALQKEIDPDRNGIGVLASFGIPMRIADNYTWSYLTSLLAICEGRPRTTFSDGDILPGNTTDIEERVVIPTKKAKQPTKRSKTNISVQINEETVIFEPGSFHIRLFVDSGETNGFKGRSGTSKGSHKDVLLSQLSAAGVSFEVRKLSIGDFAWGCIPNQHSSETTAAAKLDDKILMLPYIIERKRVDDLGSSIRDGRFHEQKFRLKKSGMSQVIYLIEGISEKLGVVEKESSHGLHLPVSTLQQASVNTEVVDRFIVRDTKGLKETAEYLAMMTTSLVLLFQGKKLKLCKKNELPAFSVADDVLQLISFTEFSKSSVKCKDLTISQVFIRQLLQIRGLSVEKAQAIIERYPTPFDLCRAYEDDPSKGELLLAKIPFGPNKRLIGPTLSKTVSHLYSHDVIK